MRRFQLFLFALLVILASPLFATTYYVGSCHGGAYGTISAAIAAVPAGSTIDVCPGTYPEQVVIDKPLTLHGLNNSNSSQAVITIPATGLSETSSIYFGSVAAQVEVATGPVTITNITVDGSASGSNCPSSYYVGIFYASGSSGTVGAVEPRNQNCDSSLGYGILAENGPGTTKKVTIQNSNFHDSSQYGIVTWNDQSPSTLTVSIENNYLASATPYSVPLIQVGNTVAGTISGNTIVASSVQDAIDTFSPLSTISANTIIGGYIGVDAFARATISDNTFINAFTAIAAIRAATITSNRIFNSTYYGIILAHSGATVESNTIVHSSPGAINFQCLTGTVTGNIIDGAPIGIDRVPGAFTGTSANTFQNVTEVRNGGC
jgi:Periplasmic copper-binding protein (NosD)